jgi:hypothetical protein
MLARLDLPEFAGGLLFQLVVTSLPTHLRVKRGKCCGGGVADLMMSRRLEKALHRCAAICHVCAVLMDSEGQNLVQVPRCIEIDRLAPG